jgi:ribose-phosphate pyrophosphokinase
VHGDVENEECLIVDDICDGGRTFLEIAKILKARGASSIELYVTHGIFSNNAIEKLKPYFDKVYCYHTFLEDSEIEKHNGFLTVFKKWGESDDN